ncbi:MAG: hypothetical protein ACJ768_06140 [Gaiellaceae bacterium]
MVVLGAAVRRRPPPSAPPGRQFLSGQLSERAGQLRTGYRRRVGPHRIDEQPGEEDLVEQPPGRWVGQPVGALAVGGQVKRQLDDALALGVLALDSRQRPPGALEFTRDPGLLLLEQLVGDLVAVEQASISWSFGRSWVLAETAFSTHSTTTSASSSAALR